MVHQLHQVGYVHQPVDLSRYRQTGGVSQYRRTGPGQERFKKGNPFIRIPPFGLQMHSQQLLLLLPARNPEHTSRRCPGIHRTQSRYPEDRSQGYRNSAHRVAGVVVSYRYPRLAALPLHFPAMACLAEFRSGVPVKENRTREVADRALAQRPGTLFQGVEIDYSR